MWLIQTTTLKLHYCDSPSRDVNLDAYLRSAYATGSAQSTPRYAILSHRWQAQEVTFLEMKDDQQGRLSKQGWLKIVRACAQARSDGIDYIWIDTCCINKDSETELSESIKSMYAYYQQADRCYVYLHDYTVGGNRGLSQSDWFTRGWTLQELVAPKQLTFFDREWTQFGNKVTLRMVLSHNTSIDAALLSGERDIDSYSVAQRMSWAARRRTTRAEDRAYSLLGIFDVDIPTNYGEGGLRAFARLQQAIVASTVDETIFAWPRRLEPSNHGLLALAPDAFKGCWDFRPISSRKSAAPTASTSHGLAVTLKMAQWSPDIYLAILDCAVSDDAASYKHSGGSGQVGIFLHRLFGDDLFARVSVNEDLDVIKDLSVYFRRRKRPNFLEVKAYVKQSSLTRSEQTMVEEKQGYGFQISEHLLGTMYKPEYQSRLKCGTGTTWDGASRTVTRPCAAAENGELIASINLESRRGPFTQVNLFYDWHFNPIVFIAESKAMYEETPVFQKSGYVYTERDLESFKAFSARTIHDQFGWNEIRTTQGSKIAKRNSFRTGLFMIKGDRLDGLDVLLEVSPKVNQYPRVTLSANIIRVREESLTYWHLEIDDMTYEISETKLLQVT